MNDFESPHERVCACKSKDRRVYRFMAGVPGEPGTRGERGAQGERGAVFTPAVDEAGNLTWTNDGGLPNPAAVNIRGPRGLPGEGGEPFAAEYGVTPLPALDAAYEAGKTILVHEFIPFTIDAWYSLTARIRYLPEGGEELCSAYTFAAYSPYGSSDSALYVCRCDAGGWSKRKAGIASFEDLRQFAVPRDQGRENAGKVLTVGADGLVAPAEGGDALFIAQYGQTTQAELDAAYNAGKMLLLRLPSGWLAALHQVTVFVPGSGVGNSYGFTALASEYEVLATFANGVWSVQEYSFLQAENAVLKNQGPENAGKALVVGADGLVAPAAQAAAVRKGTISLGAQWDGDGLYTQRVTVPGIALTAGSKVDLQPDMAAIEQLAGDGVCALYVENNNGTLTACAAGAAPPSALTLQCTVTEVRA